MFECRQPSVFVLSSEEVCVEIASGCLQRGTVAMLKPLVRHLSSKHQQSAQFEVQCCSQDGP